ncbi:unnamed protein product [Camellia sinensis]
MTFAVVVNVVEEMGGKREMSERQIEREKDRVMSERETKWSLKVHFLVVKSSVNREEGRERVSKVNTIGERDRQTHREKEREKSERETDRHRERKRERRR